MTESNPTNSINTTTTTAITAPLLSAVAKDSGDLERLRYPLYLSPKIDGIRCLIHPELGPVTRKFKPIPNDYVRAVLSEVAPVYADGELVAINMYGDPLDFNDTQSAIMSRRGEPTFQFIMFDYFESPQSAYVHRYNNLRDIHYEYDEGLEGLLTVLEQKLVRQPSEIQECMHQFLLQGYEGVMLREPYGIYKSGRSTFKQQILVKYKHFLDAEGVVIGFEELMHNDNELEEDAFGYAKRSSHKENLVPRGVLGALVLQTEWGILNVGTGFDASLRAEIWSSKSKYLGQKVTFRYQPHGMKESGLPRFPVFMHFRIEE